jgi:1,4-alpha-glucan branching enzyme
MSCMISNTYPHTHAHTHVYIPLPLTTRTRYFPAADDSFARIDDPQSFKWSSPTHTPLLSNGLAAQSIYEMHVGTFSKEGTFKGAIQRLDHVASLGFTCIELMPITDFGGAWGYNPRSCLAVHTVYGTPEDFRALVDKAHELGMAVMVDICLNHGSSRVNSLWNWDGYGPDNCGGVYFDLGGRETPWGKTFAFERAEVQEYLLDACRALLSEFRCDAYYISRDIT